MFFVEVTGVGLAPRSQSPQADSMVLFGDFCNFLCIKKTKKKKLFQNDLNECIFVDVQVMEECEQGRFLCWSAKASGGLFFFFFLSFMLVVFTFFFVDFCTEPFTS